MNPADFLRERIGRSRPLLAEHFAKDFGAFARAAMRIVHPGRKIHWNWTLDYMCEVLMLVSPQYGKISREIFNTPPRWLKTTLVSVLFACWLWINWPELQILCASCEMGLAEDHNLMRRRLISSQWYQSLFSDRFKLSEDRNLVAQFSNDRGGAMVACSIAARVLGRGGDVIVIDDPITPENALSDVTRKSTNDWLFRDLFQRQNDPGKSPIILVMQRVHQNDTTGYAMELEPGVWRQDKFSLLAAEDETWTFPISGRVVKRKKDECLDPKRFPPKVVKQKQLDRFTFAGQYLQEPAPLEGNLIRRSDVQYYGGIDPVTGKRDEELPRYFDRTVISVDTAVKDLASSDFTAIVVAGVVGRRRYVLNVVNAHLNLAGTEEEIRRQREIYSPVSAVLVEDKASGPSVIERLKQNVPGIIAVNPMGGKVSRMQAASAEWQAGDWFVSRNAAWTVLFLLQLWMFPGGRNDDQCDAMSQLAIYLQKRSFQNGWFGQLTAQFAELRRENPATDPTELALKHGLVTGAVPYNLEAAQMREQAKGGNEPVFARDRGSFGALKSLNMPSSRVREPRRAQGPSECPQCGNKGLARYDGLTKCVCGWNSNVVAVVTKPVVEPPPVTHPQKHAGWLDFVLGRTGL
jgi:predicted phage terminase large subunit-like protein